MRAPGSARLRDLLWFATAAAPGPVAIAILNSYWYGSAFRSGYGSLGVLYSIDRVWPNLLLYTGWLLAAETPFILLGLAAPFIIAKTRDEMRLVALVAVVFPIAVLALYLPYFVFEVWLYLRFLLPAHPPLLAAAGAVVVTLLRRVQLPVPGIAATLLVVAAVALHGLRYTDAFRLENDEQRFPRVADYVTELPPGAVFVSLVHSGSIRYYTGRDVLRWELVDPASLDTAIAYIRSRGHDVYFVGDPQEVIDFKKRFANSDAVRDIERGVPVVVRGTRVFAIGGSGPPPSPRGG